MNGFRNFLASFRFTGNRFDTYYAHLLEHGTGFPTADEARKDVARRDRLKQSTVLTNIR
jgi:hypothetical protein